MQHHRSSSKFPPPPRLNTSWHIYTLIMYVFHHHINMIVIPTRKEETPAINQSIFVAGDGLWKLLFLRHHLFILLFIHFKERHQHHTRDKERKHCTIWCLQVGKNIETLPLFKILHHVYCSNSKGVRNLCCCGKIRTRCFYWCSLHHYFYLEWMRGKCSINFNL